MSKDRLSRRVEKCVQRIGRKFSPEIVVVCGDASVRVPGVFVPPAGKENDVGAVAEKASFLFSGAAWDRLRNAFGSARVDSWRLTSDGVQWAPDYGVNVLPCEWAGIVELRVTRVLENR